MREREAFVKAALGEKGAAGGQKYVAWYNGVEGKGLSLKVAWCAIFVSWCARQAGISVQQIPNFTACTPARNQFKKMGIWKERSSGYLPRRGDLLLFDWDKDPVLAEHVGIVTGVENGYVCTVEGNSGNTVREKRYAINSGVILGYAAWEDKEVRNMTKEEAEKLMDRKVGEAKAAAVAEAQGYADRQDEEVMVKAKEYAREAASQVVYHTPEEVPDWARETVRRLAASGVLRGDEKGDLALSLEMLRMLVIMERAELV